MVLREKNSHNGKNKTPKLIKLTSMKKVPDYTVIYHRHKTDRKSIEISFVNHLIFLNTYVILIIIRN